MSKKFLQEYLQSRTSGKVEDLRVFISNEVSCYLYDNAENRKQLPWTLRPILEFAMFKLLENTGSAKKQQSIVDEFNELCSRLKAGSLNLAEPRFASKAVSANRNALIKALNGEGWKSIDQESIDMLLSCNLYQSIPVDRGNGLISHVGFQTAVEKGNLDQWIKTYGLEETLRRCIGLPGLTVSRPWWAEKAQNDYGKADTRSQGDNFGYDFEAEITQIPEWLSDIEVYSETARLNIAKWLNGLFLEKNPIALQAMWDTMSQWFSSDEDQYLADTWLFDDETEQKICRGMAKKDAATSPEVLAYSLIIIFTLDRSIKNLAKLATVKGKDGQIIARGISYKRALLVFGAYFGDEGRLLIDRCQEAESLRAEVNDSLYEQNPGGRLRMFLDILNRRFTGRKGSQHLVNLVKAIDSCREYGDYERFVSKFESISDLYYKGANRISPSVVKAITENRCPGSRFWETETATSEEGEKFYNAAMRYLETHDLNEVVGNGDADLGRSLIESLFFEAAEEQRFNEERKDWRKLSSAEFNLESDDSERADNVSVPWAF